MIVMMIAITPSLNASRRAVFIDALPRDSASTPATVGAAYVGKWIAASPAVLAAGRHGC
jgi:hypothetical protein